MDGEKVQLLANIEMPEDAQHALKAGALGVGLFRSEFLFLNRDNLPDEEEQFNAYRAVIEGAQVYGRAMPMMMTAAGAIAPASVNGVTISTCPAVAKSMMPSAIGTSSCSGELVLMTV